MAIFQNQDKILDAVNQKIIILDDPLSHEEHINLGVAYKKKGEIIVNFNVWGKSDNLQNDLKESFQKEVFAGIGRTVTSPLEGAAKGIRSLLPSKK